MWRKTLVCVSALALVAGLTATAGAHLGPDVAFDVPKLPAGATVTIDGDLSEWRDWASDLGGAWTIQRIEQQPWLTACNQWADHGMEPEGTALTPEDLRTVNYLAWDDNFLYFGAEVFDNVFDDGTAADGAIQDGVGLFLDGFHDGDGRPWVLGDAQFFHWPNGGPTRPLTRIRVFDDAGEDIMLAELDAIVEPNDMLTIPPVDPTAHNFVDPYGANWTFEVKYPIADVFAPFWPNNVPAVGTTWGVMVIIIDPDGTSGWGSQFCLFNGGDGNEDQFFGDITFVGPLGGPVSVEGTTWGTVKALFQ